MVFRRRTYRRVFRRRRAPLRGRRRMVKRLAVPRRIVNDFHYFKQHAELNNLTVVAGTPLFFANTFQLSQIVNNASFDTLFDHYRINAVKVTYYPPYNVYNASSIAGTGLPNVPEIYLVRDYDSAVPLTSAAQLDSYTNCIRRPFTRPVSIYLKPKVTMPVYNAGGNAFCNPTKSPWIDMANKDVVYYGVLGAIVCSQQSAIPAMLVRVTADYYLTLKNVR